RSKAPESQWPEIALRARGCYEAASPALAAVLRDDFLAAYERHLPAVVQCFRDDFERASPTSASRCAIGAWSAPPTCSSGSSWRSDVARRSSRTPSGSGRCSPQLPRVVPLGDDSVEFGPVDLGHDPWIHLLLAEVGRRHHAERREQAALDGSVVLEQRLIGNGSLVALDRLEDGAADEVVWRLSDRPSVTFRPACPVPRRGHECTSVEPDRRP